MINNNDESPPSISMEGIPSISSTNNTSSVDAFSLTPLPKVKEANQPTNDEYNNNNKTTILRALATTTEPIVATIFHQLQSILLQQQQEAISESFFTSNQVKKQSGFKKGKKTGRADFEMFLVPNLSRSMILKKSLQQKWRKSFVTFALRPHFESDPSKMLLFSLYS